MVFYFDNQRPIYIQLVEQLELYIVSGRIEPGEKLPSVRELANEAKVNPNTMQRALIELENRQLVFSLRTSGRFVTEDEDLLTERRNVIARAKIRHFLGEVRELNLDSAEIIKLITQEGGQE